MPTRFLLKSHTEQYEKIGDSDWELYKETWPSRKATVTVSASSSSVTLPVSAPVMPNHTSKRRSIITTHVGVVPNRLAYDFSRWPTEEWDLSFLRDSGGIELAVFQNKKNGRYHIAVQRLGAKSGLSEMYRSNNVPYWEVIQDALDFRYNMFHVRDLMDDEFVAESLGNEKERLAEIEKEMREDEIWLQYHGMQ